MLMERWNSHTPHWPNIVQELCEATGNIWCEIREAIKMIMQKKSRNSPIVIWVISGYRKIAMWLLWQAQREYTCGSEETKITELAEKKIQLYLREYSYYTLIADIFEREKIIQKIQDWLDYLSKPIKTSRGRIKQLRLLFTLWISTVQLGYQIREIITEIETVIEDAQFNWLEKSEQDTLYEKWKQYINQAWKLNITL